MPLELGKNAYKPDETPTHWYNDPNDPDAITRLYGSLPENTPYYEYPVLVHGAHFALTQDTAYESYRRYQSEFDILIDTLNKLAKENNVEIMATNILGAHVFGEIHAGMNIVGVEITEELLAQFENLEKINVLDHFSKNLLCGFNGDTTSKFASQNYQSFFADMKEYIEIILNAMLKEKEHAKGLLERFISSVSVCEGGAWADLKIMATELMPRTGVLSVLEKSREELVNSIAQNHASKYKEYFDDIENEGRETHINVFMQNLFGLIGKIKNISIQDINTSKLKIDRLNRTVTFTSLEQAIFAANQMIFIDSIPEFCKDFEMQYVFENMCINASNAIHEKIITIFNRYTTIITNAVKPTNLSPEDYSKQLETHSHEVIWKSFVDARDACITDIKNVLTAFDAPAEAYHFFLEDNYNTNALLTLKPRDERELLSGIVAAHSIKFHEMVKGFNDEIIPTQGEASYRIISTDNKVLQWFETTSGEFVTPFEFISSNTDSHAYVINNIESKAFLNEFKNAIYRYRIIMQEDNAWEDDLKLISQRYFMHKDFQIVNKTSPLAVAIQEDDCDKIEAILKSEEGKTFLLAKNIIDDLIGRSFWNRDPRYDILERMIHLRPDLRTALTKEEEMKLVTWAIENHKTVLVNELVQQSINLTSTMQEIFQCKTVESMLNHPMLLTLRNDYGIETLYEWLGIAPKTLEAYQLLAKTRALTIEERLANPDCALSESERHLIKDKMDALNCAVEARDLGKIVQALRLPYPEPFSRFWTSQPKAMARNSLSNTMS